MGNVCKTGGVKARSVLNLCAKISDDFSASLPVPQLTPPQFVRDLNASSREAHGPPGERFMLRVVKLMAYKCSTMPQRVASLTAIRGPKTRNMMASPARFGFGLACEPHLTHYNDAGSRREKRINDSSFGRR